MIRPIAMRVITAFFATVPAVAGTLSCPQSAPPEWRVAHAHLTAVRILSYPADQPLVEGDTLPLMSPFSEVEHGGVLHQTWNMNVDSPGYKYQVDCLYTGTQRYVRMDAPGVKTCTARLGIRRKTFAFSCK